MTVMYIKCFTVSIYFETKHFFHCLPQKIMHTKKRHQNMFQDLNRKHHHAEKDRESPASDSKVTHHHHMRLTTHLHRHSLSGDAEQNMGHTTKAIIKLNTIYFNVIRTL